MGKTKIQKARKAGVVPAHDGSQHGEVPVLAPKCGHAAGVTVSADGVRLCDAVGCPHGTAPIRR